MVLSEAPVCWLDCTPVPVAACPACIDVTALPAPCFRRRIICCTSSVDTWVRRAKVRTSSATTAKPRPISPARAASMAALSASRLVCSEMLRMTASTSSIDATSLASSPTAWAAWPISPDMPSMWAIERRTTSRAASASVRAVSEACAALPAFCAMSCTVRPISCTAVATISVISC
ncbi:hypothetical protein D3C77_457640 [compost metagenome]